MENIRRSVFETNSSSTHSLTMCTSDMYEKWKNKEVLFHRYDRTFKTRNEIIAMAKAQREEAINKQKSGKELYWSDRRYIQATTDADLIELLFNEDSEWYTYDRFWEEIDMETFEDIFTTEKGETIIAFGYFGYDG